MATIPLRLDDPAEPGGLAGHGIAGIDNQLRAFADEDVVDTVVVGDDEHRIGRGASSAARFTFIAFSLWNIDEYSYVPPRNGSSHDGRAPHEGGQANSAIRSRLAHS